MTETLLDVRNLVAGYRFGSTTVRAVRNISFTLGKNEFLGVAGESGCGKTTAAFAISRILESPGQVFSGQAIFDGVDLLSLPDRELKNRRWRDFSIVFQASMNVLNPVMKVREQIYDAITAHSNEYNHRLGERAAELLTLTGVAPRYLDAYPFQLSGGMKQRIVIAIALALHPKMIIMDEPTTALDVVVQRRILQEIDRLRKLLGFSVIFITHDLSMLIELSDRIMIMYAGSIVERAPAARLYESPLHPYTRGLMESFPPLVGERRRRSGVPGYPPDLSREIAGCPFAPRCPKKMEGICDTEAPELRASGEGHEVACHLYKKEGVTWQ